MKKNLLMALCCLLTATGAFAYSGGSGTKNDPYLISSREDMEELATVVNSGETDYYDTYFQLTRDLTGANDTVTTIVGDNKYYFRNFRGVFDGNGHEIAVNKTGIFGYIYDATIQNLGVSGRINSFPQWYPYSSSLDWFTKHHYIGGVCAYAYSSQITNCRNSARIEVPFVYRNGYYKDVTFELWTGGICGFAKSGSTISKCSNTNLIFGEIEYDYNSYWVFATSYSGGICGAINDSSSISDCYNTGNVTAKVTRRIPDMDPIVIQNHESAYAGGISAMSTISTTVSSGEWKDVTSITNCYSTGDITAYSVASGIGRGRNIQKCFVADCEISNVRAYGRRISSSSGSSTVTDCYADSNVTLNGVTVSSADADNENGRDETVANLQSQDWLSANLAWDFDSVWCIMADGQFPDLRSNYPDHQNTSISMTIPQTSYGDQVVLNASSNNNTVPIEYTSSDNSIAEISGGLLIAKKAGDVTITASQPVGNGFFRGVCTVNLTVQKKELTVSANPVSIVYGEALPSSYSCQYSGFVNGETESVLTTPPTVSCTATAQSNAGEYAITPSGAEAQNYTFAYQTGALTIVKRSLTVTPNDASRVYGYANPTWTLAYEGFVYGQTAAMVFPSYSWPQAATTATRTSAAGEYPITCSGGSATNYDFVYGTGTLTVTKAPLIITANNAVREQGADNPVFTFTCSGFQNGENESVLDELPAIGCAADSDSPVGFYKIVLAGGSDNNYDYTLVNGQLEVTASSSTGEASASKTTIYPNPVCDKLFIQSATLVEKVTIYNLAGAPVMSDKPLEGPFVSVSHLPAGVYFIRIGNYTAKFVKE